MILFLDVISPIPQFVVIDNNKIIESLHILDGDCTKISDVIQKKFLVLQKKNNLLDILNYLIVCTGPGSYTSLRVGISFMLGISYSKNLPIYGLSCIDLLSQSVLEKEFDNTILVVCSSNNQNFICIPRKKEQYKYKTYKFNDENVLNNINLNSYSKCISNYPMPDELKEEILINIDCLEYKEFKKSIIQYLPVILKKRNILHPIYVSNNKLFD